MRWRSTYIACLALLCIVAAMAAFAYRPSAHPAPAKKMNVLLISIDSLRADHMGIYGYARPTTPAIDAWAAGADVFDEYYGTSFLTPISEMSVHTGDYPVTNGLINFQSSLKGNVETLAEILKKNGWSTAAMGTSPEFMQQPILRSDFSRGFDTYATTSAYRAAIPASQAEAWMQKNADAGKPFFLWLHVGGVHWPYGMNDSPRFIDPSYDGFLKGMSLNFTPALGFIYHGTYYDPTTRMPLRPVTADDLSYIKANYDDGIATADGELEGVFDFLSQQGLDADTVVILQSEHGEDLGEHGYVAHYDILGTQTHVPLIMKIPGIPARRIGALASGIDIMPTLLDALHLPSPAVDGASWLPYLSGAATTAPRNEAFLTRTPLWERVQPSLYFSAKAADAFVKADDATHYYDTGVRNADWLLIHRLSRGVQKTHSWWGILTNEPVVLPEYELYDLKKDPLESRSVYNEHQSDPAVADLRRKLGTWEGEMTARLPGPTPAAVIEPYF